MGIFSREINRLFSQGQSRDSQTKRPAVQWINRARDPHWTGFGPFLFPIKILVRVAYFFSNERHVISLPMKIFKIFY